MNCLKLGLTFLLAAAATGPAASVPDLTVALPAGETLLQDIGMYRVFWQSYGKDPVEMPVAWTGHFDPHCGISYTPWGTLMGRQTLLMHSPWHVPPGRTYVDYELALPQTRPITLSFGIAMGPEFVAPDKSDGVTFGCMLQVDGREQELLRRHYAKAEWLDCKYDLTPYAGKTVRVRLQVEPGPKNNASFDYSFFGDAKITVGESKSSPANLAQALTSTRAYQATSKASRVALSNSGKGGVTPGNLLPFKNSSSQSDGQYRFEYQGDDCHLRYAYKPQTGTLDDVTVQMDDDRPFQPALNGGVTLILRKGDGKESPLFLRGGKLVESQREKDQVRVIWEYPAEARPLRVVWQFGIRGKALLISAQSDDGRIGAFSLGDVGSVPLRRTYPVPYLWGNVYYLPAQKAFVSRYLDWTVSHSSMCPQGNATYDPKTDGTRNPLFESGYVSVSPEVGEVLPNIPHPPSPYMELLGPRIMLDIWGHDKGTYAGDAESLRELKDLGVDHIAIIQHVWQRYGYDVKLPDHLPADPRFGGDEGMKIFGNAANECGYVWSLHENYIDLYPDAPSYDPSARVLRADGSPSPAWYNEGTKVQSFGLKCNRALEFAKQNSPEIHRRFGTTAAYLDVHTCVAPWHQLDHEAGQPMSAMALSKVKYDAELMQFERDSHHGPLFGEGAHHFFWAGRCDGVEAQVQGGEDHSALLDFDLLKIHPQMVNHGMGYYERWFRAGYGHRMGHNTGTMEQIDKYRAMELAYGHAGFVGNLQVHNWHWVVREHHLMHPVQQCYGTAQPVQILYEVGGQLVTASVALVAGDTSRQCIRYDNGLELWVNWRPEPWMVQPKRADSRAKAASQREYLLPQWGFLALGPQMETSTSLREGKFADYAECPEYIFADARTFFNMPYRRSPKQVEPRLREWKHLGGNRAQVTYEWVVNEALGQDYHCFVHAANPGSGSAPDHIVFQQDHQLPKPTSQWRPGDVIVDGPHEITVSEKFDTYDLTIGLFKNDRVRLQGLSDSANRVVVTRLKLQRENGAIAKITAEKPERPLVNPQSETEADFSAHLNPAGTWVNWGKVATDGSFKINKEKDRLIIFPYPREKAFRASIDLKQVVPEVDLSRVQIHALKAGDQSELGPVNFQVDGPRVNLTFGKPGAGRYVVTWANK